MLYSRLEQNQIHGVLGVRFVVKHQRFLDFGLDNLVVRHQLITLVVREIAVQLVVVVPTVKARWPEAFRADVFENLLLK